MTSRQARNHLNKAIKKYSNTYDPKNIDPYQYWSKILRIVDGDTLELEVAIGFNVYTKNKFRLIGVNTPETFGVKKTSEEYKRGKAAVEGLQKMINVGDWVETRVYSGKREKYGRWLAELFKDGKSVNEYMLVKGHGEPAI